MTLTQGAVPQWRDISTAPKDGTAILLAVLGSSGKYAQQVGSWQVDRLNDEPDGWEWPWTVGRPTHWMPLPPPPEQP